MSDTSTYIAAERVVFNYPAAGDPPCPAVTKCLILTTGGVCVIGPWGDDALAWAPLPKRNSEKEARIHALKNSAA